MYVRFVYGPLTICNHNRVQVSGPMNSDPINMIHTSQKLTKEGLKKNLKYILNQAMQSIEAKYMKN